MNAPSHLSLPVVTDPVRDPVVLLSWPLEDARRIRLSQAGAPRLLLVPAIHPPPRLIDELEDWVRCPVDALEQQARIHTLRCRHRARTGGVWLDLGGPLHVGEDCFDLDPTVAAVLGPLVNRLGRVTAREALIVAVTSVGGRADPASLGRALRQAKRAVAPAGLTLHRFTSGAAMVSQTSPAPGPGNLSHGRAR